MMIFHRDMFFLFLLCISLSLSIFDMFFLAFSLLSLAPLFRFKCFQPMIFIMFLLFSISCSNQTHSLLSLSLSISSFLVQAISFYLWIYSNTRLYVDLFCLADSQPWYSLQYKRKWENLWSASFVDEVSCSSRHEGIYAMFFS